MNPHAADVRPRTPNVRVVRVRLAVGLVLALVLGGLISDLIYGISSTDVFTFAGTSLVLELVALTASLVPANKATKVDPIAALRYS